MLINIIYSLSKDGIKLSRISLVDVTEISDKVYACPILQIYPSLILLKIKVCEIYIRMFGIVALISFLENHLRVETFFNSIIATPGEMETPSQHESRNEGVSQSHLDAELYTAANFDDV